MNRFRRALMQAGGGVTLLRLFAGAAWLRSAAVRAEAWNSSAFDTHRIADALQGLGAGQPTRSKDIVFFQTPEIAENGAVVPVGVVSNIPKTDSIAILIEKNPNVLAAVFEIPPGTEAAIVTRVKMAQSSNIHAVVRADGQYYVASKDVKVTLGGCGG